MKQYKIEILGLVQGIGFRPAIFNIAKENNLNGYVENLGGCVLIVIETNNLDAFIAKIKLIEKAIISDILIKEIPLQNLEEFKIKQSENGKPSFIPADVGMCFDHSYIDNPFVSCIHCGVRYTVIENLPYDRENTSLREFPLCENCKTDYENFGSKFGFAQGLVCYDCGLDLYYDTPNKLITVRNNAILNAIEDVKNGKIIAVKGVGGYHLACSPFNEETVQKLRLLKGRETKPFAIMAGSISDIENCCFVSNKEKELLLSDARPIVILKLKTNNFAHSVGCEINLNNILASATCGIFLPSTGIEKILTDNLDYTVMTSANISNEPIIYDDAAIKKLGVPVLGHKRRIVRPVEDSVIRVINFTNTTKELSSITCIIRRAKGYVPLPIPLKTNKKILALGGDLKACFAICDGENAFLSPYIGDLESKSSLDLYKKTIHDYLELFDFKPDIIACDLHPDYHSVKMAESFNLPIIKIQHHKAHIASVMAEYNLTECIGIAFDGTGYGEDGNIWGGEFFLVTPNNNYNFSREFHLPYTKLLKGCEKDSQKTYYCVKPENAPEIIKKALENNINTHLSSSIGRLFDAASYEFCGLTYNSYEGEVASKFEQFACFEEKSLEILDKNSYNKKYSELLKMQKNAFRFHKKIADLVLEKCDLISKKTGVKNIALSGGCFQNGLLISLIKEKLFDYNIYINQKSPVNDGGICLGQAWLADFFSSQQI